VNTKVALARDDRGVVLDLSAHAVIANRLVRARHADLPEIDPRFGDDRLERAGGILTDERVKLDATPAAYGDRPEARLSFAAPMHDRRGHHRVPVSRRFALALAVGVATLVAACGQDIPPSTPPVSSTGPTGLSATAPAANGTQAPEPTGFVTLPPSAAAPCVAADLKASHGLVEGAAGSRLTEMVLVSAVACSVDAFPVLGLRDADGDALVGGAAGSGRIDLVAGTSYTSAVRLSNWCLPEPSFPLALQLRLGADELPVTGGSFPGEDIGLPPCNGDGPPILEGTAWTRGA
jgi:hypothetical protein